MKNYVKNKFYGRIRNLFSIGEKHYIIKKQIKNKKLRGMNVKRRLFITAFLSTALLLGACSNKTIEKENQAKTNQQKVVKTEEVILPVEKQALEKIKEELKTEIKAFDEKSLVEFYIKKMNEGKTEEVIALFKEGTFADLKKIEEAMTHFDGMNYENIELIENKKEQNENEKKFLLHGTVLSTNEKWNTGDSRQIITLIKEEIWKIKELKEVTEEEFVAKEKVPVLAKAIYLSGPSMGVQSRFDNLIRMTKETEINAAVIDVKEDKGFITFDTDIAIYDELGTDNVKFITDIEEKMKVLKENNVYTIARIVTFKDPHLATVKPEWAMKDKNGNLYYDRGVPWVDPYKEEVWEYVIQSAKLAAKLGFDEIQFDYVRFPDNAPKYDKIVTFDNPEGKTKAENIRDFLLYAKKELAPYGVFIAADIFGIATSDPTDSGIGHHWETLTQVLDYTSPMIYPSHYAPYTFGIPVPDANPYGTIKGALEAALKREEAMRVENPDVHVAKIRPWLQDFTASWVPGYIKYGPQQVKDQIRAAKELGIDEYLIWDPANTYNDSAFK